MTTSDSPNMALPPGKDAAATVPSEPATVQRVPPRRASERFRREQRRELRYHLSVAVARILSFVMASLPSGPRAFVVAYGSRLWWRFVPTYRAHVRENVRQVLTWAGREAGEKAVETAARTIFHQSALNFADLLCLPHTNPLALRDSVTILDGDLAIIDEAISRGQGLVLLTAHLGAFEFVGHGLVARGYPLSSLTGRTTSRFIFDAVTYLRGSQGIRLVDTSPGGVRRVIQALRGGECVAFLADYDFFQNGLPVTLFGRETTLPPGPIRIARATGALVVGCFARRTPAGYALSIRDPFIVERTNDLDRDVERGMARAVNILQQAIAETPEQWVMFQQVWREAPVDPVRVFPVGSPLESDLLRRVDAVLPEPRRAPAPTVAPPTAPPPAAPTNRTDPPH